MDINDTPVQPNWLKRHARSCMTAILIMTDVMSFMLAFSLALLLHKILLGLAPIHNFFSLWPALALLVLAFISRGLYPAIGMNPVEELRLITTTTSLIFLMLLAVTYWLHTIEIYSRLVLTVAWLLSLLLIQVDRWVLRAICSSFWGEPIVIIGDGPNTEQIIRYLLNNNHLGMRPVMALQGGHPPSRAELQLLIDRGISMALLVTPEVSEELRKLVINNGQFKFRRVILISSLGSAGSLGVVTHDMEGILSLEVRQNLLNFWQRSLKRLLDVTLAHLLFILVSPLLLMVSIAIKLEGKGGVLFKQCRIGRNGREFIMWKFRTMIPDADHKLQDCLSDDPQLKNEWDAKQKLNNDPRLTRVGKLIRKWSLDELPQLINVMRGEMSLVGPRPFFSNQLRFYGEVLNLYYRVSPGMSGMWQVTSRNEATFADRVRLDEYYIRNWSIWLDIYIIVRTIWVVLRRRGAY